MPETAVVTLLFCDLVGSTELLRSLGDDANDEVRRSLLDALARETRNHGGTVVKSAGDGVMAAFRTSAADAVACAIAMQRAAAGIERHGAPLGLELRVGVSSGEASHEDGDWFGTPVVEAARLEAAARPGQILVSGVVVSIVGTRGGARFRPAGKRELKGFERPVPVVEVVWRDTSSPPRVKRKTPRRRRRMQVGGLALAAAAGIAAPAAAVFVLRDSDGARQGIALGPLLTAEGYTPVLEPRDCPPESASTGVDVRCHDLIVPESRDDPSGRQVRILVAVVPSSAREPGVPTLFLYVGIGGSSIALADLREYGDSIIMGTRGEEFVEPQLTCPEISAGEAQRLTLPLTSPESNDLYLDAVEQCGRRLVSEGVDLDAYGLGDVLLDVRDLAIAMGWRQINIEAHWGASRIPALLAARYPGLVRSVVLSDPLPPNWSSSFDITSYNGAFESYNAACHADDACDRAFPALDGVLAATYERYQRERPLVTVPHPYADGEVQVMLDGDRLVVYTTVALLFQNTLSVIPSITVADDEIFRATSAAFIAENQDLDPATRPSYGVEISQYCEDEEATISRVGVEAQAAVYPLFRALTRDPHLEVCERWPTEERSGVLGSLGPASPVPALIFSGALNPYSPPLYAEEAVKQFRDATVAVFPSMTAYLLFDAPPCVTELRAAFLRDPFAELDVDACIASVPPIKFEGT